MGRSRLRSSLGADQERRGGCRVAGPAQRVLAGLDRRAALARIRCPVLILAGEHDGTRPPARVAEVAVPRRYGPGEAVFREGDHVYVFCRPEDEPAISLWFGQRIDE